MAFWNSRELPLFNFKRLNILCGWIWPPCEKLWPFEFLESLRCSISSVLIYYKLESYPSVQSYDHLKILIASIVNFRASLYVMRLNRISELKVKTIWISPELPLFNFERVDILCGLIWPPFQKLYAFEFLESFRCSISSVSICFVPESDMRVKRYDHLNFSRASVVQFLASRYAMRLNRTSEWKDITIWISQELPLFNIELLDILYPRIGHLCEEIWAFEFVESFRCSISSV